MPKLIVLLSGRICTGKSTLAGTLAKQFGFQHVSTRDFLRARERAALQTSGARGRERRSDRRLPGRSQGRRGSDSPATQLPPAA